MIPIEKAYKIIPSNNSDYELTCAIHDAISISLYDSTLVKHFYGLRTDNSGEPSTIKHIYLTSLAHKKQDHSNHIQRLRHPVCPHRRRLAIIKCYVSYDDVLMLLQSDYTRI